MIGRSQLHVMLEEQSNAFLLELLNLHIVNLGNLLYFLVFILIIVLRLLNGLALIALLKARILRANHALNLSELPCLIGFTL